MPCKYIFITVITNTNVAELSAPTTTATTKRQKQAKFFSNNHQLIQIQVIQQQQE